MHIHNLIINETINRIHSINSETRILSLSTAGQVVIAKHSWNSET